MKDRMREAIEAARYAHPHPNPRVGALVLHPNGTVVGRGVHQGPGEPHAEVTALIQAGSAAAGGTLVVNLEPCNHHGRNPPCTEAIIEAGISRVIVAVMDPDPNVNGKGIARLQQAGLEVVVGVLEAEAEKLDPGYFHHRRTGLPRVTLKAALTMDGAVAARDRSSRWITSPEARRDGHELRAEADAVMIGAGTLISDNPALTVRLEGGSDRRPIPIVIGGNRPLPPDAKLFERPAIVFSPDPCEVAAEVIVLPGRAGVDLEKALVMLGERGILDVLVEGGPSLARSLLDGGLVQRGVFYYGAKLAGGAGLGPFGGRFESLSDATELKIEDVRRVGADVRVEFLVGGGT